MSMIMGDVFAAPFQVAPCNGVGYCAALNLQDQGGLTIFYEKGHPGVLPI